MDKIGRIGAQQHKLAMSKVEDAHHAGDDAEAENHKHDDRPEAQHFKDGVQCAFHSAPPRSRAQPGLQAPKLCLRRHTFFQSPDYLKTALWMVGSSKRFPTPGTARQPGHRNIAFPHYRELDGRSRKGSAGSAVFSCTANCTKSERVPPHLVPWLCLDADGSGVHHLVRSR